MKILILGFGKTGKTVYNFLKKENHQLFIYDQEILNYPNYYSYEKLQVELPLFDLCVRSPGISKCSKIYFLASTLSKTIISDIELALNYIKSKHIIGVTGSNGKTTTSLMIQKVLDSKYKTYVLGNIGEVLLSYVDIIKEDDIVILELSSYMMENTYSLNCEIVVVTSISPNHLNGSFNLECYYGAKKRIIINHPKLIVCNQETSNILKLSSYKYKDYQLSLFNKINNVNANYALICGQYFNLKLDEMINNLKKFQIPIYRQQIIKETNELVFINDSKSTSSSATNKSIEEYSNRKIVLILEGIFKGESVNEFDLNLVDYIYSYGQINKLLNDNVIKMNNLEEILQSIYHLDLKGYVILFSPGGASLDLYNSYIERGNHFNKLVNKIWK